MSETKRFPGMVEEAHPELFDIRAMPPQPSEKKPGQLSEDAVRQYFEKGYVLVENFFTREELDACKESINGLVEELAQKLYKAGKIKNLYSECGFFNRLTMIEKEFPGANIILHKLGKLPKACRDLWSNERLLNVIEQIIGPDIAGSPVWNLRTKTPNNEATIVPWHQDSGYFDNESYKVMVPTAWIPLLDTNEENGCLEMAERAHRTGRLATHQCCYGNTWYVMLEEEEMEKTLGVDLKKDLKVCPVPYGGFVLFSNMIPHRSLPNVSKDIRWSLDLRWQRPDQPYGLYGLKQGIVMRSSKDPNVKADWDTFDAVDRNKVQAKSVEDMLLTPDEVESEFDTTIQGPWMKKWEIVHVNAHVRKHQELQDSSVMQMP